MQLSIDPSLDFLQLRLLNRVQLPQPPLLQVQIQLLRLRDAIDVILQILPQFIRLPDQGLVRVSHRRARLSQRRVHLHLERVRIRARGHELSLERIPRYKVRASHRVHGGAHDALRLRLGKLRRAQLFNQRMGIKSVHRARAPTAVRARRGRGLGVRGRRRARFLRRARGGGDASTDGRAIHHHSV